VPPHRDNGRAATPEETFERFRHHVSPITGVVTRLWSREADASGPTYNWAAGHYFPIPVSNDPRTLATNLFTRAGGKGATEIQAKAGALCEALERYSGIAWGAEPTRHGTREQLGDQAVSPRGLLLFSDTQYRDRETFNARNRSEYHDVPPPLPDDAEIAWTPACSLTHARFRYLPKAYCFYGHLDPGHFFVRADSNGCAAGSSLEEAILEGLLEVIERDAIALWWYNRVRRPQLDVDAFGLRYWRRIRTYHDQELGRSLHLLDLTSDLGVPTFVAVSCRRDRAPQDITIGFGAHVDAAIAIQRAISESNQYLPALRESADDGSTVYRVFDADTVAWWKTATLDNQPYLKPAAQRPRRPDDFALPPGRNAAEDLHTCLTQVRARGLEVLVVNQTRPDVGLPVVKVVVPGLRHFWRRLAPGRLYDVPVQLGWLDEPTPEENMNPISCFI
jgi:ribosomal protein S12 methylthiotransferase accessory factor